VEDLAASIVPYAGAAPVAVLAPPGHGPLLVLPGFGNESNDYAAPFGMEDASLLAALRRRGFAAEVLAVERKCWFNVARALFTPQFFSSTCTAEQGYRWYLDRVEEAVQRLQAAHGGARVTLVGHSAGGWLARAFLASGPDGGPHPGVSALVSLGTPHQPPPAASDPTRGALAWLHASWPGAAFAPNVRYVCVAGRAVSGSTAPLDKGSPAAYSARSYTTLLPGTDGHGVMGDAVVPTECALLPGSAAVVLPGVWHSMARVGTFDEASGLPWYGSEEVVDHWLEALVAN